MAIDMDTGTDKDINSELRRNDARASQGSSAGHSAPTLWMTGSSFLSGCRARSRCYTGPTSDSSLGLIVKPLQQMLEKHILKNLV